MGYETCYTLHIEKNESEKSDQDIIGEFRREYDEADVAFDSDGCCADPIKWYEHEEEMAAFSRKHPDVVFSLHGLGEDGERWYKYFKNGKVQFCPAQITFDDYDENKLKMEI